MRSLVWFRSDLRVRDNPALHAACAEARRGVVAVFALCPGQWREHDWGGPKVEFVLRNLRALSDALRGLNVPLRVLVLERFAEAPRALLELARGLGCDELCYNRELELNEVRRDAAVTVAFERAGLRVRGFSDQCIWKPGTLRTGDGRWYSIFSPFQRRWREQFRRHGPPRELGRPRRQERAACESDTVPNSVESFAGPGRADLWPAGETEARERLERFIAERIGSYGERRDLPGGNGTSTLSPYLSLGVVSVRQCLLAAMEANDGRVDVGREGVVKWISELIWREFYRNIVVGFPRVCMHRAFRPETESLNWSGDQEHFAAWCDGRTGIPIVDAGMRQLAQTGWMHNRVRMITAMFLTKDLFIDWRWGERHFMRGLVDGDLASNNGGWQWSASTGTDAAPYFRVFNPVSQSRRFDPQATYIRKFLPELAKLDDNEIHEPYAARGAKSPLDYPRPIIDLTKTRARVIEAFSALKRRSRGS